MKKVFCFTVCLISVLTGFAFSVGCSHSSEIPDENAGAALLEGETTTALSLAVTKSEADPWVYKHSDGTYYYTATYPDFDRVVIRRAQGLDLLDAADTEKKTILTANSGAFAGVYKYIWAPELHCLDGSWYLFYTGSVEGRNVWGVRSHVAKCTGDDPFTGSWTSLGKIKAVTGDSFDAAKDIMTGFNLDGTAFKHNGQWYYVWAQYLYKDGWADETKGDGAKITVNGKTYTDALNKGDFSSILIGKVVEGSSFTQITNATPIAVPEYAWECGKDTSICAHSSGNVNVNEGPAILQRNGKVFIVFSAAACDESYCLGLLTADENADLCKTDSWTKTPKPVFTTSVKNRVYGPGHCSFTTDKAGNDVIVYHARPYAGLYRGGEWNADGSPKGDKINDGLNDGHRSARAQVFTWNADGSPNFGAAR